MIPLHEMKWKQINKWMVMNLLIAWMNAGWFVVVCRKDWLNWIQFVWLPINQTNFIHEINLNAASTNQINKEWISQNGWWMKCECIIINFLYMNSAIDWWLVALFWLIEFKLNWRHSVCLIHLISNQSINAEWNYYNSKVAYYIHGQYAISLIELHLFDLLDWVQPRVFWRSELAGSINNNKSNQIESSIQT